MNFSGKLPVNWFDIVVVAVLVLGYVRGRKHGMSKELLVMLGWLAAVLISAIAYQPLGLLLDDTLHLGRLISYILAYVLVAGLVLLVFFYLDGTVGRKLASSDAFGKSEFYLAMPAGMLRFGCVLLAFLALLNARLYRTAEVKEMQKYQMDNYGSQFFPTLASIQSGVFEESFTGPQIRKYMGFLLIEPTYPGGQSQKNTASRRRDFTLP